MTRLGCENRRKGVGSLGGIDRHAGVGVVTRRVQWLASLGMVAVLGIGAATALAPSASARPRPRHVHVHTAPVTPTAPVTTASFSFTASVRGLSKGLGT